MLRQLKHQFEEVLEGRLGEWGEGPLGDACRYALTSSGKRVRPIITYLVGETWGENVDEAALSVEYFHTASLIADDLPCMDDDEVRRGKATLHRAFDEPTALLASYALITKGFEQVFRATHAMGDTERGSLALELASVCSGIDGATGGQYLDLKAADVDEERLLEILYKKTVTLFQVAFGFGFLFGGGPLHHFPLAKKAGYHFGMAFQIADDVADWGQDEGRLINSARFWGVETATARVERELRLFEGVLAEMGIAAPAFREMQERILYLAAGA